MGAEEDGGRFRGEDWFFTELAHKLEIPVFINANSMVDHKGTHTWTCGIVRGPAK